MDACEAAGLNINETKVYRSLLLLGKATVTKIHNHTGLERTMLYGILRRLSKRGIVTHSSDKGIKQFSPAPPESLLNLIKLKEEAIKKQLPDLNVLYTQTNKEQSVRIYSGTNAVKNLLDELLNENKPWYVIGGTASIKAVLNVYLPQFHRKREEKRIGFNVLFTKESTQRAKELKKEKYTKIKFLPNDFAAPMHVAITGKKVALNLWESNPVGILIESETVAKSFRKYFSVLWKLAKS